VADMYTLDSDGLPACSCRNCARCFADLARTKGFGCCSDMTFTHGRQGIGVAETAADGAGDRVADSRERPATDDGESGHGAQRDAATAAVTLVHETAARVVVTFERSDRDIVGRRWWDLVDAETTEPTTIRGVLTHALGRVVGDALRGEVAC
jgi:hypothetical protein